MTKKREYGQFCSLARALDVIGERWTLLIIRDLLAGPKRYKDLLAGLPGMGTNLLAGRLKHLEDEGLVEQKTLPPPVSVKAYHLTDAGRELEEFVIALARWGINLLKKPRKKDLWMPGWNAVAFKARFNRDKAEIDETYAFRIDDYPHYVMIHEGRCSFFEGPAPHAAFMLACDSSTFLAVFVEQTVSLGEVMERGLLTIDGSMEAFNRFLAVFS